MCGVIGAVEAAPRSVEAGMKALLHRGPDAFGCQDVGAVVLGHTRLSVLDLRSRSDQPMRRGRTTISFNGEIWNYMELRGELRALGRKFVTSGDTEVVAHAIDAWGEDALPKIQGMFAIAWTKGDDVLHAARDRFGEVPLHYHFARPFMVASEVKALVAAGCRTDAIRWVAPGGIVTCGAGTGSFQTRRWYEPPADPVKVALPAAAREIAHLVRGGAIERSVSDAPACTLLSGGIDSAAVALALKTTIPDLVAYTAVMDPRSPDLRAARLVAGAIGVELREVEVPVPTQADLASVIRAIEMPHKAQVEIGWACLVLARRMQSDGFKVTFSGEGSDELWASYGFAYHGLKKFDWHEYRRRLFLEQHRKNFSRCNKVFMAHGIECRLPFLSTSLVEYALSLPRAAVQEKGRPKSVLQRAFAKTLPGVVTKRQKLAFQDGLGLKKAIEATAGDPRALYMRAFKETYPGLDA